jgi:hypothetical protein
MFDTPSATRFPLCGWGGLLDLAMVALLTPQGECDQSEDRKTKGAGPPMCLEIVS